MRRDQTTANGQPRIGHSFPEVGAELVNGTSSAGQAVSFLVACGAWRDAANARLDVMVEHGQVSAALRDLLRWSLGYPASVRSRSNLYYLTRMPDVAGPGAGNDRVLEILTWRSGIADFLADIWDTIGPADYELEECGAVIDELFKPATLRDVLHYCPDCLQTHVDDMNGPQHIVSCPIRLRRMLNCPGFGGRFPPWEDGA